MIELFSDEVRRDPFALYAQLRETSPVYEVPLRDIWMLFDYASVKRAMTDVEAFSSAARTPFGPPPDWVIFNDPPRHTGLRALILKAFTPRAIAALEPRIRELSLALLSPAVEAGAFDLIAEYAAPLPAMVIAEVLGIAPEAREQYLAWVEAISKLGNVLDGDGARSDAGAGYGVAREEMRAYLAAALDERRRSPRGDLLSGLLAARLDDDALTEEDIFGFFQLLIFAGTETTVNLIGNAVISLDAHPDAFAALRAEPALIPGALEEVLRYRPPAVFGFRETRRDVEIGGQTIPQGRLVLPVVAAANRDPAVFAEPDRFDIRRDPNPHIGFGHGAHFCLGAALARLEARIALGHILELAPGIALADAGAWAPRPGHNVHGARSLPVRVDALATA
jgi:cytochrome P450